MKPAIRQIAAPEIPKKKQKAAPKSAKKPKPRQA
jgi:hypothetical protein